MASICTGTKRALPLGLASDSETPQMKSKRSDNSTTTSDEGISEILKCVIDLTSNDNDEEEEQQHELDIKDYYQCSSINTNEARHSFIQNFGVKSFLVHHDYILFPYCFTSAAGKRERPSPTLVSSLVKAFDCDERYNKLVERLQPFDTLLNRDTSHYSDMETLASDVGQMIESFRKNVMAKECVDFMEDVDNLLNNFTDGNDRECLYRAVFASFLRIVAYQIRSSFIREGPDRMESEISFPNCNAKTKISGKPDIIICKKYEGQRPSTLAVVECKRYREIEVKFEDRIIKDDFDLEKAIPRVRFCKVVKTSGNSDELAEKEHIMERMNEDLDASICRPLRRVEKSYFGCFFAQLVGEGLAWFNTCNHTTGLVPLEVATKKSVRYAIGQLGFKIIFITIGMNNSNMGSQPHIRISKSEGMGLDVFMTRPLDLMKADDRGKIRDILYAMMSMPRATLTFNR